MNKDFWKGVLTGFVFSLLVIYSFFRIYWIMEVGLRYLHWHAVLWRYVSIAAGVGGIGYLLYKSGKLKNKSVQKIFMVALGLFAGFYCAEIFLRLTNIGTTYSEKREGVFVNPADRMQKSWYKVGQPNQTYDLKAQEYSFSRTNNSLGLADKEWTTQKDTNEIRLLTLGDSFTEGDGAAFDSSYPSILERLLQNKFSKVKINVMNAGECGSDPYFEYKKLSDLLLNYKPDIVVYTNGSNDLLFDHLCYGGMERFLPDSTVKNKIPKHSWMGLYEISYVFRLIIEFAGYDDTFFGINDRESNKKTSISDSHNLSRAFSQLAVQNSFKCIQLIRPEKADIEDGHYDFDLSALLQTDSLPSYSTFNILPFYLDSLHINQSNVQDYFWFTDGHHNAKGYQAMAEAVYSCVKPVVLEKTKTKF